MMDTFPETFSLSNPPAGRPPSGRGFRVPFGLRDGRVWAPGEVAKGRACDCVCPGCHSPLVAKAKESRRRRPHFAHLSDVSCQTGRETGIHLRAKQIIVERAELLTPTWNGDLLEMANPPQVSDNEGRVHLGSRVDYPAARRALSDIEPERSFGDYRPDIYARDDVGELLIEIRVTHAVDQRKAARVQAHGRRMVEIDLSCLDPATPHDPDAFERAVLFDACNRDWISCPEAVLAWRASKEELDRRVKAHNQWLAQQRELEALAEQAQRDHANRQARDKAGRKEYVRNLERRRHAADLAQLMDLTSPERIAKLLREYQETATERVSGLLDAVPAVVRSACLRAHPDAWIYGVDPALWQLLAYEHFVAGESPGHRFNQKEVASWVRRSFQPEHALYRLFVAQYANRANARRAGFFRRTFDFWVFTNEENNRIPDFYVPINEFVGRLEVGRLIRRRGEPIGEFEVLPPPTSGWYPLAHIDSGTGPANSNVD